MSNPKNSVELHGLVLAGGQSVRMGRDKAEVCFHGIPELSRMMGLLEANGLPAFVSISSAQETNELRTRFPCIPDVVPGAGPLGGIYSAQESNREVAWLVVGCDMPYLTRKTLGFLVAHRDPAKSATAFRQHDSETPEPMCAIYEPSCFDHVVERIQQEKYSPRRLLTESDILLLDAPDPTELRSVNDPDALRAAQRDLGTGEEA